MENTSNLIDVAQMEETIIDLEEFINSYKEKECFITHMHDYGKFNNFDSNRWVFYDELAQHNKYIEFSLFDDLITDKIISYEELQLIKCLLIEYLDNGIGYKSIMRYYNSIYSLIEISENFRIRDDQELSMILKRDAKYLIYSISITDYINFLDSIGWAEDGHLVALNYFYENYIGNKTDNSVKALPKTVDIFKFGYYMDKFYNEENDEILINLFFPLRLWWKITNVIPMRPSEFTTKIKRNCIKDEGGNYLLYINRVKVTSSENSKVKNSRASIPLLNRVGISKDIYDLIQEYLNITSSDELTETLLSYKTYKKYSNAFHQKFNSTSFDYVPLIEKSVKVYQEYFNLDTLNKLLELFYSKIIKGKYGEDNISGHLNLGDTRHLAFTTLMLQGISPIEIAMLGGHTTLAAQNHYTYHASYYVDSEILKFIANKNIHNEISSKSLKDIILGKPRNPYKDLSECNMTDDGVGYCTADFNKDVCGSNTCVLCSLWWCYPSNFNYVKMKDYIETKSLIPLREKLIKEEKFLTYLLKTAKVVNIDGLLELDKDCDENIQKQVTQIKSVADEIIFLQKKLIEYGENNDLLN